jgi:hypothetical protein
MIIEEHLLSKYETHPLLLVGTEGAFGLLYVGMLLPVLNHFRCSFLLCDNGRLENVSLAIKQLA